MGHRRNRRDRAHLALIASLVLLSAVGTVQTACADELLVGTAKLELVPPTATPLAGYSRRRGRPALGVHDPTSVRAIVLRRGDAAVALVSCDLLIIDEQLFESVREQVDRAHLTPPVTLLVAATHTHSGPGAYGRHFFEKLSLGHFDPAVFSWLSAQIAKAVVAASAHLQPATVAIGSVATNGLVTNRMHANGVVDPELSVLTFSDHAGHPLAIVVNFSAHPTTLGASNRLMSADYPGVLVSELEQRSPTATCLFFAGAVGDQAPVKRLAGFEETRRLGGELARQAIALLEQPVQQDSSSLSVEQRVVRLPPAHLRLGPLTFPRWLSQPFVDDDATLTMVGIGHVVLIGVPCDLSAELGLDLKRYARERHLDPLIVGFADDYIGYCLPPRLYRTRSYEASMAFNGPNTGAMLVEELKRMIDQIVSTKQQSAIRS